MKRNSTFLEGNLDKKGVFTSENLKKSVVQKNERGKKTTHPVEFKNGFS